jgi:asparagine synthase (glutamine-hydrolysing)
MTDDVLAKVDRMAMAHSLEVRVPFLDHTLVEFAARLPWTMKRRGGVSKWLLRRVASELLPPAIVARGKQGFAVPLERWFGGDFDRVARERLDAAALSRRPELDPDGVRALVERATGPARIPGSLRLLWSTLLYVMWAETFVDRAPQTPRSRPRLLVEERVVS